MLDTLRLLLPRPCPGCGRQLGRARGLCPECEATLRGQVQRHSPLHPQDTPHLVTLGTYQGTLRRSVRALKFQGAREVARPLGLALARTIPPEWGICAVVPVPLHPARQRERGYNQAELLAQVIASEFPCLCLPLLRRVQATAQQARRHAAQRQSMQEAFQVNPTVLKQAPLQGNLLVVDDVLTTGRTLLGCREALLRSGIAPERLRYAVIAR